MDITERRTSFFVLLSSVILTLELLHSKCFMTHLAETTELQIDEKELFNLYFHQEYEQLSKNFIRVLEHFRVTNYIQLAPNAQHFINIFVKNFLYFFTQPDYILSDYYGITFIKLNAVIANLVAISSFKTTDAYLEILNNQPNNFVKTLALYSARNTIKIDRKLLFDTNSQLASLWYSHFYNLYISGCVAENSYHNLQEHLAYIDERYSELSCIDDVFFGSTYINCYGDRAIKEKVNQIVKNSLPPTAGIRNNSKKHKIAVITALWLSQHSVYRTLSQFIESLKDDYELTLIHLGSIRSDLDVSAFKEIKYAQLVNNSLNIDSFKENEFIVVYYPDIGMSLESIILANLRIAPIQVCGYGHSVSTFGAAIDYFIGGADVEIMEEAAKNYSERLILLPGAGVIHNHPSYTVTNISKTRPEFIINCSWFAQKLNYLLLRHFKEIVELAGRDIIFRFFSGSSLIRESHFIPFEREIKSILGESQVDVVPNKSYEEYMAMMEEGDICLDSYPFGGCNTMADSLYLRKPIVTFEGTKWYNRIGSYMLRSVGLEELIATNVQDYTNLTLKLIQDDEYRLGIQERLRQIDLNQTIFNSEAKEYFKKAIAFLIENHEQLKTENSQEPIFIT